MQFMEMSKKAGFFKKHYMAGIVIAPESEEHYLSELSQAGGGLVEWKEHRGDSGRMVTFTIVCDPEFNETAKGLLVSVFENTPAMMEISNQTEISASILNSGQIPVGEFTL